MLRPVRHQRSRRLERRALPVGAQPARVLFLWGREDRFVPLPIGERVQNEHPWIELKVVENSGHCPHDETPELFHQELLHWLDRNLGHEHASGIEQQA